MLGIAAGRTKRTRDGSFARRKKEARETPQRREVVEINGYKGH